MKLKLTYILAIVILIGVGWYLYSGNVSESGQVDAANAVSTAAEQPEDDNGELFKVKVVVSNALPRQSKLEVNGRIEAYSEVVVKAETSGVLLERPFEKGMYVNKGQTLCVIDNGTRNTRVREARAALENAAINYSSSSALKDKGFSTEIQVTTLKANLDAARARLDEALKEVENTTIEAPVSGRIETPIAEVGSLLNTGATCATIVTIDPMVAIGQVSERDIDRLEVGMNAQVKTLTGITVNGVISYISHTANADTRTFRVEVEVPNQDGDIRDGISATLQFQLTPVSLHKINSSSLTLDEKERVGVQTVNDQNIVEFLPVELAGGENDGLWITGLPETVRIVTVGQEYVVQGQEVEPLN